MNRAYPFARAPKLRRAGGVAVQTEIADATVDRLAAASVADPMFTGSGYGAALSRWVGGKREQLNVYDALWPDDLDDRVFVDPTMGSGTIFFHLAGRLRRGALLADVNPALVNAAQVVQARMPELEEALAGLVNRYNTAAVEDAARKRQDPNDLAARRVYLAIRDLQRARGHHFGAAGVDADSAVSDAAIFFMLVWTAFNGLWRVNGNGQHNAPHDHTKTHIALDSKLVELRRCHAALNRVPVEIRLIDDFSDLTDEILAVARAARSAGGAGAFVYIDPPYAPVKPGSFVAYAKDGFGLDDQIRLRDFQAFLASAQPGLVQLMSSNALTPETLALYGDSRAVEMPSRIVGLTPPPASLFTVTDTFGSRRINRDAANRGLAAEIVTRTY